MLQVVDREFEKLRDSVDYINKVNINYGYLKHYQILKEDDKYNLFLDFDVPEVTQFLELAKLKQQRSEDCLVYKTYYTIEVEDKSRDTWSSYMHFSDLLKGFMIQGSFGFKNYYDLIKIFYNEVEDNFSVELRNFEFESSMGWWRTIVEDTLMVQDVDHKVIYNHLIKLMFNRGYLIDKTSLKELEDNLYYVAKWLNEKKFE